MDADEQIRTLFGVLCIQEMTGKSQGFHRPSLNLRFSITLPSGGVSLRSAEIVFGAIKVAETGWKCPARASLGPLPPAEPPPSRSPVDISPPVPTIRHNNFPAKNRFKKRLPSKLSIPTDYLFVKQIVMIKEYKRTTRHLSPETRAKISAALRGRRKPKDVCKRISKGLRKYWSSVEEGE